MHLKWRRTTLRRCRPVVGMLLLGLLCSCSPQSPVKPTAPSPRSAPTISLQTATVIAVLDADSITVRLEDGRELRTQMLGIDAPDAGKPQRGHANDLVRSKLAKGRRVYLEQGPQLWDNQGRYLVLVWLRQPTTGTNAESSTRMLNAILLVSGLAEVEPDEENPKYETLFRQLQVEARRAHRGIWG